MKIAGTLKIEIIKPADESVSWREAGSRMHAISRALGYSLNNTLSDFYPQIVEYIKAKRNGDKATLSKGDIEKALRENWNSELARSYEYRRQQYAKKIKGRGKKVAEPNSHTYLPITEYFSSQTVDLIMSRFAGDHLKDLIVGNSSLPSWNINVAFSIRERACRMEGKADKARLSIPLWGAGNKATTFIVAPSGGSAIATWNKLIEDFSKRKEIVDYESRLKDKNASAEDKALALNKLETMEAMKLGKISIKFNNNKRKWFALISWTKYQPDVTATNKSAAVNFGVNVFLQALCEDGSDWSDSGRDILVTRLRFQARRKSIQFAKRNLGKGSRGHGKKRRELPLTKIGDKESRWVETRIRTSASHLIKWCNRHGISDLYVEDLSGIRDAFEKKTQGDAPEELKRYIHNWPYFQTIQAIEYEGKEHGVRVHTKSARYNSQRCPCCENTDSENVVLVNVADKYLVHNNTSYKSFESFTRFKCTKCGLKGRGDIITCANNLKDVGCNHSLEKQQEKSKKRIAGSLKRIRKTA